ncbi:pyocin knob domain-containing protein [Pseudophaeobacter sp.]|uniref:Uncharacterized protein n=1 Tax=Pseudophaeobacter arcticus TaxID=385492 RepID=A0ABQ0ALH1_9RHOB
MTLNFPDMPPFPDLADGANYNQAVLDMFTHLGVSMVQYMEGLSAEDFFQVMSSLTDTTAGKVMINGAHGLGGAGISTTNGDCNAIAASGSYTFESSTLNRPAFTNGTILHIARTSTIHTQLAISRATSSLGQIAVRAKDGTNWSDWKALDATSGNNANGEWVRLPNGTQICTCQAFQTSDTADTTWTYPASFLFPASPGRPAVSGAVSALSSAPAFLSIGGIAGSGTVATDVAVRAVNLNGDRVALAASLIAIGRWF